MAFSDFFSSTTVFVVALLIIAIWIIIEIRRFRHKIFAIFLIILILFLYTSVFSVFNGKDINLSMVSGIVDAGKVYFSWIGSIFGDLKTITSNVLNLNWSQNFTTTNNNI